MNIKKSISFFAVTIFAAGLIAGCGGGGEKKASPAPEKIIKAGCTGVSYPDSFKENGKLTGYDVEILELAAKNLGYKVEWVNTDFAGLIGQLDAGKIDTIANNVSITPPRKEKYYFSEPFLYEGTQFVAHKDNKGINKVEDLFGKTVAGVAGSNHLKVVAQAYPNGNIKIRTYENRDGAMNDLVNKRVDGYVNARNVLVATIKKANLPFKLVGDLFVIRPSAYPFLQTERGKKLNEELTKELQRLRKDGTMKKISEKYYGTDVSVDPGK